MRWLTGTLAVALALVAMACGSGANGSDDDVPPSGTRVPLSQPTIDGGSVNFPAKGYRLEIPPGWEYEANAVRSDEITPDFLIFPEEIDGVQANVTVTCEILRGDAKAITLDEFVENKASRAQELNATDIVAEAGPDIEGVATKLLTYNRVVGTTAIVRRDLLFVNDDCAWQLAYTAAPSSVERFQPDVNALISSFGFQEGS
jgi:hypothetical protein